MHMRHLISAGLLAICAVPAAASAALITYQGQGIFTPDPSAGVSFGLPNGASTFTYSFGVDTEQATLVPAGTVISSSGAYFPEPLMLYEANEISNFSFGIGTSSWSTLDLINQALGTSGSTYAILMSGNMLSPSGFKFAVDNMTAGFASLGQFTCGPECSILPQGDTFDYSAEGGGITSAHTLVGVAAVPEPATWAMMILGFGAIGAALRSKRRRNAAPALA